jgi:hypothetical protein
MKKIAAFLGFILLGLTSFSQPKKFDKMVGRWEFLGEQGSGGVLEILDSSTINLTYMGETRRIQNLNLDFSRTPFWFDFTTKDTASEVNIKSLMEVVNDSLIKWQLFVDEDRTNHFTSSKGELFYLKRTTPVRKESAITSTKQ